MASPPPAAATATAATAVPAVAANPRFGRCTHCRRRGPARQAEWAAKSHRSRAYPPRLVPPAAPAAHRLRCRRRSHRRFVERAATFLTPPHHRSGRGSGGNFVGGLDCAGDGGDLPPENGSCSRRAVPQFRCCTVHPTGTTHWRAGH